MTQQIWGPMSKDLNNNQSISDAIAEAVTVHNDDPDAHLGPTQALQSHRAAEVIDHLAESVVNDKIQRAARAYVAVVGSGALGDFSTLQAAIEYAAGLGGGTILLLPGTHYLAGAVNMPTSINIAGVDRETCIISVDATGNNYLNLVEDAIGHQRSQTISNITFTTTGGPCIQGLPGGVDSPTEMVFEDCKFTGGGAYLELQATSAIFRKCIIDCGGYVAIFCTDRARFYDCEIKQNGTTAACEIIDSTLANEGVATYEFYNTNLQFAGASSGGRIAGNEGAQIKAINSTFNNTRIDWTNTWIAGLTNCDTTLYQPTTATFSAGGTECTILGGKLTSTGSGYLDLDDSMAFFIGVMIYGTQVRTYNNSVIEANPLRQSIEDVLPSYSGFNAKDYKISKITPNVTKTYTTSVARVGERWTLIVTTSGATSYTLTLGTGFKAQSTLVTGTTTGKVFSLHFISDGTKMVEQSRTAAM